MTTSASASSPVARPVSSCWSIVLDAKQAAATVPGLHLGSPAVDDLRRAELGEWFGWVRLLDIDEDNREVSYELRARRADTARHASLLIGVRLLEAANGCRVDLEFSGTAPAPCGDVSGHAQSLAVAIAQALESAPAAEQSTLEQPGGWGRWAWPVFLGIATAVWVLWRRKVGVR